MIPWLSVVIPTAGQRVEGLLRTLASIRAQSHLDEVEVLVVADTYQLASRDALDTLRTAVDGGCRWLEHDGGLHCYGQPQRSFGARRATGAWVAFSQDDNILAEGALDSIHGVIARQTHARPLFFRVQTYWGELVWREPYLWMGNIDADCIVLPGDCAAHIEWGLRYEGDFDAATAAVRHAHGDVAWRKEVIAIARPESVWW